MFLVILGYYEVLNTMTVNPNGFGQGIVYRNFDYTNKILLA